MIKILVSVFQIPSFLRWAKALLPVLAGITGTFLVIGYSWALGWAPPDDQQGSLVTIMYLHVPCAWLGTFFYGFLGVFSGVYLVWRLPLSALLAKGAATAGITFTAVCLLTGAFWGVNSWGTWWVWDARLTSVLILFFLYVAYFLILRAYGTHRRAQSMSSLVAVMGLINLPIIKWSVTWWSTLHQAPSLRTVGKSAMTHDFWMPLMICAIGWLAYGVCLLLMTALAHLSTHSPRRHHV